MPGSIARRLTRRGFLRRSTAVAAGLSALACGRLRSGAEDEGSDVLEDRLSIYTWAEYHNPQNTKAFARRYGVSVAFDVFESVEAMVAKLELAKGASGYDIVVPTAEFLPQLVRRGFLRPLDRALIPNLDHQDPKFAALKNGPEGDPDGAYSVVKDWGSTGFVYDHRVITEPLHDWAGFFKALRSPAVRGLTSILPSPAEVVGLAFWRDGIDPHTVDAAELDRVEKILLAEVAPFVKAFDVYPAVGLIGGDYVIAQCWNGDARKAVVEAPDRFTWVLGAPRTNLWIAVYAILADAPHPRAAHAWINEMLEPQVAAREIEFTGNATAVKDAETFLPAGMPARDLIFFSDDQMEAFVPSVINAAQPRLVEIYNKVRLAAGRA